MNTNFTPLTRNLALGILMLLVMFVLAFGSSIIENGIQLEVVQDSELIEIMSQFIERRFELWNEDIGETA